MEKTTNRRTRQKLIDGGEYDATSIWGRRYMGNKAGLRHGIKTMLSRRRRRCDKIKLKKEDYGTSK